MSFLLYTYILYMQFIYNLITYCKPSYLQGVKILEKSEKGRDQDFLVKMGGNPFRRGCLQMAGKQCFPSQFIFLHLKPEIVISIKSQSVDVYKRVAYNKSHIILFCSLLNTKKHISLLFLMRLFLCLSGISLGRHIYSKAALF